jgi:RNA polymerase-binding transcription factor DksA
MKPAAPLPVLPRPETAAAPADARWEWHHRALLRLRARLAGEHGARMHAATASAGGEAVGFADSVSDQNERDLNVAELRAEENQLDEVDAALARLHAGTYGVCEDTGQPISAARLRAVPWTRWSREAAQRRERAATVRP